MIKFKGATGKTYYINPKSVIGLDDSFAYFDDGVEQTGTVLYFYSMNIFIEADIDFVAKKLGLDNE